MKAVTFKTTLLQAILCGLLLTPAFKCSAMVSVASLGQQIITEGIYWGSLAAYQSSLYNGSDTYLKNVTKADRLPSTLVAEAITRFNSVNNPKKTYNPARLQLFGTQAGLSPAASRNSLYLPIVNNDCLLSELEAIKNNPRVPRNEIDSLSEYKDNLKNRLKDECAKLNLSENEILPAAEIFGLSPFGIGRCFKTALVHEIGHLYHNHPIKEKYAPFVSWGLVELTDLLLQTTSLNNRIQRHPFIVASVKSSLAYIATKLYYQYAEIQADNEVMSRVKNSEDLKAYAQGLKSGYAVSKARIKLNYPRFGKLLDRYPVLYQLVNRDHPHPLWRADRIDHAARKGTQS